jgi:hypothetical protein
MPYYSRSDFTAANGSAWPLTPGSWSNSLLSGSITVSTTVNNNAGRVSATNSNTGVVFHAANASITATHVEVRARVARVGGFNAIPYLIARFLNSSNYLAVLPRTSPTTSGVRLQIISGGSIIVDRASAAVSALQTTGYVWLAARVRQINGLVIIQAKCWLTTEPDWLEPTSFNNGDGNTDTGSDWARLWHVWVQTAQAGQMGLLTNVLTGSTGAKIDFDDWSATEINFVSLATATTASRPLSLARRRLLSPATAIATAVTITHPVIRILQAAVLQTEAGTALPFKGKLISPVRLVAEAHWLNETAPLPPPAEEETGFDPVLLATRGVVRLKKNVAI